MCAHTELEYYYYLFAVDFLLLFNRETIELDHGRLQFGNASTTLAWKIHSAHTDCNSSQIVSYPPCQPNNVQFSIVTNGSFVTLPSEAVRFLGVPSSISISSLSDQPTTECPKLPEILRFYCKFKIILFF